MYNFFNQLAIGISMIGRDWTNVNKVPGKFENGKFIGNFEFLNSLFDMVDFLVIPLMIAVCSAGAIYAVILGVNLARAEDAEKREAAKKRMIWAVVGIVSIVVLILVLNFVASYIPVWVLGGSAPAAK